MRVEILLLVEEAHKCTQNQRQHAYSILFANAQYLEVKTIWDDSDGGDYASNAKK